LSGIFTAQNGLPYSAMVSFDLNNDGNSANDRTPGVGRNTFSLPRMFSLDARVTKNIRLGERSRIQILIEGFNVFNRTNLTAVRTTQFAGSNSSSQCGVAGTPCLLPQGVGVTAFWHSNGHLGSANPTTLAQAHLLSSPVARPSLALGAS